MPHRSSIAVTIYVERRRLPDSEPKSCLQLCEPIYRGLLIFEKFNLTGWFDFQTRLPRHHRCPLDDIEYDVRESDFAVDQAQRFDTVNSGLNLATASITTFL